MIDDREQCLNSQTWISGHSGDFLFGEPRVSQQELIDLKVIFLQQDPAFREIGLQCQSRFFGYGHRSDAFLHRLQSGRW